MLPPNLMNFGIGFVLICFGMSLATYAAQTESSGSAACLGYKASVNARTFIVFLVLFAVQIGIAVSRGAVNWALDTLDYVAGANLTAGQLASTRNLAKLVPSEMYLAGTALNVPYPLVADRVTRTRARTAAKPPVVANWILPPLISQSNDWCCGDVV